MARTEVPADEVAHGHRWYVVASGSRGRAYVQRAASSGYDAVREWDEPEARARDAELGRDRPGRVAPAAGPSARSGIELDGKLDSPKEHAKHHFAQVIASDLAQALRSGDATGVVLVGPAPFLQALREGMPHDLQHAILAEEARDLTQLPTADLFARLDALRRGR